MKKCQKAAIPLSHRSRARKQAASGMRGRIWSYSMNLSRLIFTLLVCLPAIAASGQETRLLRHPTVSRDLIAFEYAGDLWTVPRAGGQAHRLTSTPGVENDPYFSPDGSHIAFTATVAGNS